MDAMDSYVDWENLQAVSLESDNGLEDMSMFLGIVAHIHQDQSQQTAQNESHSKPLEQHFPLGAGYGLLEFAIPTANTIPDDLPQEFRETTESPCFNCVLGSYTCERITEGVHIGQCTSCTALGLACSFGHLGADDFNNLELSGMDWSGAGGDLNHAASSEARGEPAEPREASSLPDSPSQVPPPGNDAAPDPGQPTKTPGIKSGARFSRESVRILKNWLLTHHRHPYPSDKEKEMLQRQTGLNRTQIANWLANARRRGKAQPHRPMSPQELGSLGSLEIPPRRATPALETMNPLQRWAHSPPEHEPASVSAIARAVTASGPAAVSSGLNSPFSLYCADDSSNRSLCNQSSASSAGTSRSSNGSRASAYSHGTLSSWGSLGSVPFSNRSRRRRRRRSPAKDAPSANSLAAQPKTFQCTFCTDTFRTKHDWQRHEKSLHLSLERWVCAPESPRATHPSTGLACCAFCGEENPDDAHIEGHNHSACQERSPTQRTFYRKDHLNQHLRLVHNVKFLDWSMKSWQVSTPEIQSRCGFCGVVLGTWAIRIDHLAEHFKAGYSMADWKGDWGFEPPVLDMIENAIPPYLIHQERVSPHPYHGQRPPPASPRNAYELIKLELAYFEANHLDQHCQTPTDEDMMLEGCRIIFASELLSLQGIATQPSWLRDLIMSKSGIAQKARFGPLRGAAENRLQILKINGKDNLFEACPMETQLHEFVKARRLLGLTAMDDELQEEACRIVGRVEEVCNFPSEAVANWLLRIIRSTTDWLPGFRRRAHLPRSEDVQQRAVRSSDPTSIDSTIHNYSRLESELANFLKQQRLAGLEPTDADLQREARMTVYEFDDGWNQTVADNHDWLSAFRERNGPAIKSPALHGGSSDRRPKTLGAGQNSIENLDERARQINVSMLDSNWYQCLAKDLRRWVVSIMSPNNPNQHVPSDEEIQHQARWMFYDEDDPWNQTAADNPEWLQSFKRDVGILKEDGTISSAADAWAVAHARMTKVGTLASPSFAEIHAQPPQQPSGQAAGGVGVADLEGWGLEEHIPSVSSALGLNVSGEGLGILNGLGTNLSLGGLEPGMEEIEHDGGVSLGLEAWSTL